MREPAPRGWETVIGLEVHAQLRTATKMFCRCPAAFGAPPNTQVCPVCLGLPGSLPVPNREAVRLAVRAALVLGCTVRRRSEFVRKNYFYPDLPKGYQITQYADPLAADGRVWIRAGGGAGAVRVRRLHLEEDAGKSIHDRYEGRTAVDLNRAGVPLVEIVTEPDLRSPAEARACLTRLKQLLEHYAAVSDCNMEEGSLRVDANISVRRPGSAALGTKTEVKNLNSFRFAERALVFERDRQARLLASGRRVERETRLYDPVRRETRPMRGKEELTDYRYFPEPDLPPLEVERGWLTRERERLGALPHEREERLVRAHGLSEEVAAFLAATPDRADYFDEALEDGPPALARTLANLMTGEVAAELNRRGSSAAREADLLHAADFRRVAELRLDGTLSSDTASRALRLLFEGASGDVDALVSERGLAQVADARELEEWVDAALRRHPEEVDRYAAGEEKLFGYLMGAVMRSSGGKADPAAAKRLLSERLQAVRPSRPERGGS